MPSLVIIDFETRSAADLKAIGAYEYWMHESTAILCLCWMIDGGEASLWHPAYPGLGIEETPKDPEFLAALQDPSVLVEAHNAFFERTGWASHAVALGFPEISDDRWRCSAAKCRRHGLPGGLSKAALALKVPEQKDNKGRLAMLRMSKRQ